MTAFPTRTQLLGKLDALELGSESREAISAWAMQFILSDAPCGPDVRTLLTCLGAADLAGIDRPYLYAEVDFAQWRAEFGDGEGVGTP